MQKNISDYKAKSFITEKNLSSIAYEVKRTRAVWDDALSIPGTNRRGGWRCPPGTRYGGQITDRFGRNCGWGVSRRLANQITDIGERLEGVGERRQARREQRAVRRQGRPGAVERAAGRVARALESTDATPEAARPRRERRGPAQRRPSLRDSEQRRMEREIAEPGAPRTDQRRRRATAEVVERPRPAAPVAEPVKKAAAKKAPAKKAPAKKAPAKKAPAKKAAAKKTPAKKSPAKKSSAKKAAAKKSPVRVRVDSDNAANSERMRQARAERERGAGKKVDLGQVLNDDGFNGYILNVIDNGGRLEIINDPNNFGQTPMQRRLKKNAAEAEILRAEARLQRIEQRINRGELGDNDYIEFVGERFNIANVKTRLRDNIDAWKEVVKANDNPTPPRVDSDNAARSEEVRRANLVAQNADFFNQEQMRDFIAGGRGVGATPDNILRQLERFEERLTRDVGDAEGADIEIDDIDRFLQLQERRKQRYIDDRNRKLDKVNELRQRLAQNEADPEVTRQYWFAVSQFVEANHEVRYNIALSNAYKKRREELVGQIEPESASEILRNENAVKEARNRVAEALKQQQSVLAEYLDKRYGKDNKPWLDMTPEKLKDLKERAVGGDAEAKRELITWAKAMYEHPLIEGKNGKNYQIVMDQRAETARNGDIYLKGTIYHIDENGRRTRVGSTEREVHISADDPKDWYVKNAYLKVESERHKKAGIATTYNQHAYMWANAAGIPKALVSTAWDGPYVWARAGFRTNLSSGQVNKMELQLRAFRRGDMGGLIKNEAEAVRIASLIREFKLWERQTRSQRPSQPPVGHIDFIYALDIERRNKVTRQKQLKDWFVANMGLGSGEFDFAQNGITKDPRD